MPGVKQVLPEIAHQMGALPLLWLVLLRALRQSRDAAWWWLAGAFAISWLADWGAHWQEPEFMGLIYPVSQAGLIAAVLLSRRDALRLVLVLTLVGIVDAFWQGTSEPDVLLRVVAWGSVVGIVWPLRALGLLRWALLVSFGLALLPWLAFGLWGGWSWWGAYQSVRLTGILLFCGAALWPVARLKVAR